MFIDLHWILTITTTIKHKLTVANFAAFSVRDRAFLLPGDSTDYLRRRSSTTSGPTTLSTQNGYFSIFTRSSIISVFVILLLVFLLCSSIYLVFRVDALERQVRFCRSFWLFGQILSIILTFRSNLVDHFEFSVKFCRSFTLSSRITNLQSFRALF